MTPMTEHLTDDDLVLHFYGEMDHSAETAAVSHLAACDSCRRSYTRLQRVLAAVDALPAPVLSDGFERTVWARLEPQLPPRRGWFSWLVLSPGNLAWVSAVVLLVVGAFMAGRMTQPLEPPASRIAGAEQVREGVLLMDLEEHLDRSQTMLVELVSAQVESGAIDMSVERERAEDLVAANRLYRQVANQTGDVALRQLLDELERLLVELAASPDELPAGDMEQVQQRVAAKDLLFKVRVVSTALRERQRDQLRTRNDIGT